MPQYYHAEFGGNWKTNKGETEGGGHNVCIGTSLYGTKIPQPE